MEFSVLVVHAQRSNWRAVSALLASIVGVQKWRALLCSYIPGSKEMSHEEKIAASMRMKRRIEWNKELDAN